MSVFRVVVDKKVLDGLKRRMLKEYPEEHIEAIMGTIKYVKDVSCGEHTRIIYIHAFDKIEKLESGKSEINYYTPDDSLEIGTKLKYLGTIHSHPDPQTSNVEPRRRCMCYSLDDVKSFRAKENANYPEIVADTIMAIVYVRKQKARKFFGVTFYNEDLKKIELVIAEDLKR